VECSGAAVYPITTTAQPTRQNPSGDGKRFERATTGHKKSLVVGLMPLISGAIKIRTFFVRLAFCRLFRMSLNDSKRTFAIGIIDLDCARIARMSLKRSLCLPWCLISFAAHVFQREILTESVCVHAAVKSGNEQRLADRFERYRDIATVPCLGG